MKTKRVIRTGDNAASTPASSPQEQTDSLLSEMSRLYRERFRAMYNKDLPALQTINNQIDELKTKLAKL
jgi:hypothetical protein